MSRRRRPAWRSTRPGSATGATTGVRGFKRAEDRIPDFITVAAVILIAVSVLWPVLSSVRQKSIDEGAPTTCASSVTHSATTRPTMGAVRPRAGGHAFELGFGSPRAQPSAADRRRLLEHHHLTAPATSTTAAALGRDRATAIAGLFRARTWAGRSPRVTVVLGDLNPMIDAARAGSTLPPLTMSVNHAGRGQNVLTSDGRDDAARAAARRTPRQHLAAPRSADALRSGVRPDDPMDVFPGASSSSRDGTPHAKFDPISSQHHCLIRCCVWW